MLTWGGEGACWDNSHISRSLPPLSGSCLVSSLLVSLEEEPFVLSCTAGHSQCGPLDTLGLSGCHRFNTPLAPPSIPPPPPPSPPHPATSAGRSVYATQHWSCIGAYGAEVFSLPKAPVLQYHYGRGSRGGMRREFGAAPNVRWVTPRAQINFIPY